MAIDNQKVSKAADNYNKNIEDENLKIESEATNDLYEDNERTVNITPDDVVVKKQKENRDSETEKDKKSVKNTIFHVENQQQSYTLNGYNMVQVFKRVIAFLLYNGLFKDYHLQFFVDGERALYNTIYSMFDWLSDSYNIILDWYHLKKKCKYELSLALNNTGYRQKILDKLLPQLWLGKLDTAIECLNDIDSDYIKSKSHIKRLIGYFERNRKHIPCYALRKQLNLRNSSNKGEKQNDLMVSDRQKNNGMSWSNQGSVALATITTLLYNEEAKQWYSEEKLDFKLSA